MDIALGYDAFSAGLADVRAARAELDHHCSAIGREVGALLDSGWRGAAADSFAEAWADWLVGATQVREALASIESSLAFSSRALAGSDDLAAAAVRRLRARLAS